MNSKRKAKELGISVISVETERSIKQSPPQRLLTSKFKEIGTPVTEELQILVYSEAFFNINLHTKSDLSHEVAGFLVGYPYYWEGKRYIEIVNALSGDATSSSAVHVTLSPQTWMSAMKIMQEKFPTMYIVGWYHTHPKMPIFMSSYDKAIHEGFFKEFWCVSLVIDPSKQEANFFIWDGDIREVSGYHIEYHSSISKDEYWHVPMNE